MNGLSRIFVKVRLYAGSGPSVAVKKPAETTTTPAQFRPFPAKCGPVPEAVDSGKERQSSKGTGLPRGLASRHCEAGDARTNYQVLPGDRVYVVANPLIVSDVWLGLFLAPFERAFGVVGLGNGTVRGFLTPVPTNVNALSIVP